MITTSQKDKNQSILEFYEALQLEYFICEIRRKIYISQKDKNYYKKVMDFKRSKIEDLSLKNGIPSIFSNEDIKIEYIKRTYPKCGLPEFIKCYNNTKLAMWTDNDNSHYYSIGKDIKIVINDNILIGTLDNVDFKNGFGLVKIRKESTLRTIFLKEITRIL